MFEDIKPEIDYEARSKNLEKKLLEGYDILKESRDKLKELEHDKTFYENRYVDVFTDNKRLIKHLKDNLDEKTFEKIMSEDDISVDIELEDDD